MDLGQVENHSRTIIHIDLDCFYAQVEMNKNPALQEVPLGIQQKSIVVTSNYKAREYGIKKCMTISNALELCPSLVLIKGEDLHDYRQISYKITTHLQKISPLVERLGLDENYIDVTDLVTERLKTKNNLQAVGHVFGQSSDMCQCGCFDRLCVASSMAQDIRESIKTEFKLTSTAGIAHNKLLAKLVGATHKPNQQTVIYPNSSLELLLHLRNITQIPGIGKSAAETLETINIRTIEDLQNCDIDKLLITFPLEKAKYFYNLSYGRDMSIVKASGKPQSIGLEDSCKSITVETEVTDKIEQLLKRLLILINEDGRMPRTIKIVVRKFDNINKVSHRETKQCNLNPSLFSSTADGIQINEISQNKIMTIIMKLFTRIVDIKRPYHITLLGLSFTKFQERVTGKNSIVSFLKKDVEVQAITSIENKTDFSTSLMDYTNSQSDFNTDGSESELEPSPKKKKFSTIIAKRRCFTKDCPSPSKLNVAELRINSREMDNSDVICSDNNQNIHCPPNADKDVFKQLPNEMREELWQDYLRERDRDTHIQLIKRPKLNTLLNYFVKN